MRLPEKDGVDGVYLYGFHLESLESVLGGNGLRYAPDAVALTILDSPGDFTRDKPRDWRGFFALILR